MTFYDRDAINSTPQILARPPVTVGEVVSDAQSTRAMAFRAASLAKELNEQLFGGSFPETESAHPERKLPALSQISEDMAAARSQLHVLAMWLEKLLSEVPGPQPGGALIRNSGDRYG